MRSAMHEAKVGEGVFQVYAKANMAFLRATERAFEAGLPLPQFPNIILDPDLWGEAFQTDPPRVTYLAPLLFDLPPLVPRCEIGKTYLRGVISEGSVRRDMDRARGPRVCIRGKSRFGVFIPAVYLLEYLETKGKKIVTEQL